MVVGGSKTTDEEMLKSAREVVYDEKIAYLENVRYYFNYIYVEKNLPINTISFLFGLFFFARIPQSFLVRFHLSLAHYIATINSKTTMN